MQNENEYVGTHEASQLTGLSQNTIQQRCRNGYYQTAEQDDVGCPWRILKQEVLDKMKRRKIK